MISRHPGVFLMSVGIGFACVKHCARGFNLVMEGLEGLVRLFGRTGE